MDSKKFILIKKILLKNGIEDEDMLSLDWWMSCVDMEDMMRFIRTACTKDDELAKNKKKL